MRQNPPPTTKRAFRIKIAVGACMTTLDVRGIMGASSQLLCEETLPTTGRPCSKPASIIDRTLGARCATCALRYLLRQGREKASRRR